MRAASQATHFIGNNGKTCPHPALRATFPFGEGFSLTRTHKRLKNLSAVLIHAERKFGVPLHSPDKPFIRQAYGLRQSILRDSHSRQPRRKRFMA